jgi:UDP-N-acetylmuramate dehydrogenase
MTLSQDPPIQRQTGRVIVPSEGVHGLAGDQPLGTKPICLDGCDGRIQRQVPLSGLTSFRVGGPAELYATPRNLNELRACFEWGDRHSVPITLLGAGSNLLVSDRGLPGLVIATRYLRHSRFDDETGQILAGAGVPMAKLAWQAARRGWQGFEWAVGIPGSLGGSVVMNAGAHGLAMADVLVSAAVLSPDNALRQLAPTDLNYRYRTSNLQGDRQLVTSAVLQLQPGVDPQVVLEQTSHHLERRRTTQPYHLPSCGSVFRNPSSHSAGWLIEQTGLKGYQIGGAQVADRHANFILNVEHATAADIFRLIRHVQEQVEHHWSLLLMPEVKMLGEFPAV